MKLFIHSNNCQFEFEVDSNFGNSDIGVGSVNLVSVSKVKTLAAVDVEKVKSIEEFVENTVTENRLKQGLEVLRRDGIVTDMKATGHFVKWISSDIAREEADTLEASGLTMKDVGGKLSSKARTWFHTHGIEAQ